MTNREHPARTTGAQKPVPIVSDHLGSVVALFAGLGAYSLQRRRRDRRLLFVRITAPREVASPLRSRL